MKRLLLALLLLPPCGSAFAGSADQEIDTVLAHYFQIHQALSRDTVEGIAAPASAIVRLANSVESKDPEVSRMMQELARSAAAIEAKDLGSAREEFAQLSKPLLVYLNQHYSGQNKYYRYYCSMVKKAWVQNEKEIRNPYHGSGMLRCGELIG